MNVSQPKPNFFYGLIALVWAVGLLLNPVPVSAEEALDSNAAPIPTVDISSAASLATLSILRWRDEEASTALTDLPPASLWTEATPKFAAKKYGREWIRFRLTNSGEDRKPAVISFDEVFPEEANFYSVMADNSIRVIESGLQTPIHKRTIQNRVPAFEISLAPGETRDIFLSYRTRLEALLGVQVHSPVDFGTWVARQTAGFAFFGGGAIAIIIFNLFLFASLREPLYLIYSLHASFVVLYVARFNGYTFYIFNTPESHYLLACTTWLQAMLLVMFTRRLLETRKLAGWIDKGMKAAQIWFAVVGVVTLFNIDFHSIGVRSSLILTLSFLGVGIYSGIKGNPMGIFYTIAQTPYLIGYFLFAGLSIGIFEFSLINRYGYIVGTFFELVTFSLALGYRFRLLERDKFDSQADLLALQGTLNEQLQLQVTERTSELASATEALRRINSDYEALLQNVRVGIVSIGNDKEFAFTNSAYQTLADHISGLTPAIHRYLDTPITTDIEELIIPKNDGSEFHLLVNSAERFTGDGSREGSWVIVTDVTAMRAQEANLNHASKMATLGEMSTGMAHELNQPLNVIQLTMENIKVALQRGKADTAFLETKFERIDDQVQRASKVISLMRTYGRVAPSTFEPFDITESINRVSDLMQDQLRLDQISLNIIPPGEQQPLVKGSSSQFEQVLVNLITNARDAISKHTKTGGTVTIATVVSAEKCCITVTDTGGGIADDVMDRIFEPFFTTKAVGEGTGLGGAISYGIIQDMQGTMTARNATEGALIEITLPRYIGAL